MLPLAAACWAAVAKNPGLSPLSLLELLKRRGRYRPEDFERLNLVAPFDLVSEKGAWLVALAQTETFVRERPVDDGGCLYYSTRLQEFVVPRSNASLAEQGIVLHFGSPGGVLPRMSDTSIKGDDAK